MKSFYMKRRFKGIKVNDLALFAIIAGLFLFFTFRSQYFLSFNNLMNMVQSIATIGIAASAVTCALIGSGIDLTIGAVMAATSCLSVNLIVENGWAWWTAILLALLVGLVIGYISGCVITLGKIPPMVATLGMNSAIRGIAYVLTDAQTVYISDRNYVWFGIGRIGAIPVCGIIMIICFIIMYVVSKYTRFGREIYATGGNKEAARLAGINTGRVIRKLYSFNGLFSALAGVVMAGIVSGGLPQSGETYGTDIVTAVVLGGTKIGTGEGSVMRTLLGLLAVGIMTNGMSLLNIPAYYQMLAKGILMLTAVILSVNKSVIGGKKITEV